MKPGRKILQKPEWLVCFAAACLALAYMLLADPFYIGMQKRELKKAYEDVCLMELSLIDEEDEEILQSFQTEGLEFLIVDQNLEPVYYGTLRDMERRLEKSVRGRLDLYQETPDIAARSYNGVRVVRLRALIRQDDASYYVYIRKTLHDLTSIVRWSALYFSGAAALLAALCAFLLKKYRVYRFRAPVTAPDSSEEYGNLAEAQNEFVANISHELKTPLSVISGQVEMLQNMGDQIDRDYYFSSIREEIDKMSGMVSDLLDLTIMEHRLEEMELSTVDLSNLMGYMLMKYDALFKKNKIRVSADLAENCLVHANRMYLEEAVNNYIMNAFQHTAQGKEIRLTLVKEDRYARIGVYNQGSFVAPEDTKQIWQSFYKTSRGRRAEDLHFSNAGLGLYMVQKIVEQHHGTCDVQNMEKGVEFWMRIPLEK